MWDSAVIPCCTDNEREYVLDDAKKEKLKDIWHNERYKRIRNAHIAKRYYQIGVCRKCYVPVSSILPKKGK